MPICAYCKKEFIKKHRGKPPRCCSKPCGQKLRQSLMGNGQSEERICLECSKPFMSRKSHPKVYCGQSCVAKNKIKRPEIREKLFNENTRKKISTAHKKLHQTERGREIARKSSERMTTKNPTWNPETAKKIRDTKEARGSLHVWKGERGGNGKLTEPQKKLHELLSKIDSGWKTELPIPTKKIRPDVPYNYKVDLGNKALKIGVEIDGKGHRTKKAILRDAKKTDCLEALGWYILRFTNKDVMTRPSEVLSQIQTAVEDSPFSTTSK